MCAGFISLVGIPLSVLWALATQKGLRGISTSQYRNAAILDFIFILFCVGCTNAVVAQLLFVLRIWGVFSEFQLYFTLAVELGMIMSEHLALLAIAVLRLKGNLRIIFSIQFRAYSINYTV